ncbi:unnamed protein product [Rotaria magnacalcarata]|uniref:Uncharacterized protein n=1 Tax=Rotaria magnacalcarata TaxID=392030 RepID=A0A814RDL3_9BILA|nr:unnamed protein product [Rotaria magnacalcarata]CAF1630657.1 unnamed protein product [Rotaria magnacalcarata]CAF2085227.1 unnamed protein product [Rotaria magnacalcarata]CAF2092985.1 unnamed protein product [Rotaria magnacalcarata]CAF2139953.1 unnamed protein product [Rotaria magnacalcarata]
MVGQSYNCVFSILILILCISTNVLGNTCSYPQKTCSDLGYVWCCESYELCGNYFIKCYSYPTTTKRVTPSPSNMSSSTIIIITLVSVSLSGLCMCCCACLHKKQQRSHSSAVTPSNQERIHQNQQQLRQSVHDRSIYTGNTAPPSSRIFTIYEDEPPSYEVAIADLASKDQLSSPPLSRATSSVELDDTRL